MMEIERLEKIKDELKKKAFYQYKMHFALIKSEELLCNLEALKELVCENPEKFLNFSFIYNIPLNLSEIEFFVKDKKGKVGRIYKKDVIIKYFKHIKNKEVTELFVSEEEIKEYKKIKKEKEEKKKKMKEKRTQEWKERIEKKVLERIKKREEEKRKKEEEEERIKREEEEKLEKELSDILYQKSNTDNRETNNTEYSALIDNKRKVNLKTKIEKLSINNYIELFLSKNSEFEENLKNDKFSNLSEKEFNNNLSEFKEDIKVFFEQNPDNNILENLFLFYNISKQNSEIIIEYSKFIAGRPVSTKIISKSNLDVNDNWTKKYIYHKDFYFYYLNNLIKFCIKDQALEIENLNAEGKSKENKINKLIKDYINNCKENKKENKNPIQNIFKKLASKDNEEFLEKTSTNIKEFLEEISNPKTLNLKKFFKDVSQNFRIVQVKDGSSFLLYNTQSIKTYIQLYIHKFLKKNKFEDFDTLFEHTTEKYITNDIYCNSSSVNNGEYDNIANAMDIIEFIYNNEQNFNGFEDIISEIKKLKEQIIENLSKAYLNTEDQEVKKDILNSMQIVLKLINGKAKDKGEKLKFGYYQEFTEEFLKEEGSLETIFDKYFKKGTFLNFLIENGEYNKIKINSENITEKEKADIFFKYLAHNTKEIRKENLKNTWKLISPNIQDLLELKNKNGSNIFHFAVENKELLEFILKKTKENEIDIFINQKNNFEKTPLFYAITGSCKG